MLLAERQNLIIEHLNLKGRVYAAQLADDLNVSEDTIRRDLNKLGEMNLLRRVHGGALPLQHSTKDYIERIENPDHSKLALALIAVKLIKENQVIYIDTGDTCRFIAKNLPQNMPLTVVTGSPFIACELIYHDQVDVIILGGKLFKGALRTVGYSAIEMVNRLQFDICFVGICALHLKHGVMEPYLEEAEIGRVVFKQSNKVVLMGNNDSLDKTSKHQSAEIHDIDVLITNGNNQQLIEKYSKAGLEVLTC